MSNTYDMTKHLPKKGKGAIALQAIAPGTPIQVDLKNAKIQICFCGGSTFSPAIQIYKVSAIISPTGQELIANQQVLVCTKCGATFGEENVVDITA